MPLPVRQHPYAAPGTQPSRRLYDVVTSSATSDPCLEFLPEERVFLIVPAPIEPPRYVAQRQPQHVGLFRRFLRLLHPLTVLSALHRGVVGILLALYRGAVGTFRALYRGIVGILLALYRGVVGTLVALGRGVVGTCLALYRGVVGSLLALYRGIVGILLALYRGVVGTLASLGRGVVGTCLALYRGVVGRLLALYRGVAETLLALRRRVVGTILALCRGVSETFSALRRSAVETLLGIRRGVVRRLLALRRCVVGTILALCRGVSETLSAMRRSVAETLSALHRGVVATHAAARWTTLEVARWTWRAGAGMIDGTTSIGISGLARFRRFGGNVRTRGRAIGRLGGDVAVLVRARLTRDISTIGRVMSMGVRDLSVVMRSFHERCRVSLRVLVRNARQVAMRRQPPWGRIPLGHFLRIRMPSRQGLGMRMPVWAPKVSAARVAVMNVTMVAVTGGAAVSALVIWLFGTQPDLTRLTDTSVVPGPDLVVSELAASGTATAHAATPATILVERQGRRPSPVSAPKVVMSAAVTVMSTPAGARVTVDGIGWGETPVTVRHLPPGQKVVRVTKEGYESQQRIVNVPDDRGSAAVRITLRSSN